MHSVHTSCLSGEVPSLTEEGALRAGDFTATVGTATVRIFQGSLTDVGIRTRGEDVRVTLKEFPSETQDGLDLANNEAIVVTALASKQIEASGMYFPRLYGTLTMNFVEGNSGQSIELIEEWIAALGVPPPRLGSKWLVYAYEGDGDNTLLSFSRPTALRITAAREIRGSRRSLALPPLPRDVPWY